ncbi:MAG: hypothetical protein Q9227_009469 [Pyrenula ochraceoflavens]
MVRAEEEEKTEDSALPAALRELTPSQRNAHTRLKELCRENSVSWRTSKLDGGRAVNDDLDLLRFLTARSFDPLSAFNQYRATATWRASIHIAEMYDTSPLDDFETMRRLLPQWTGRRDRNGIPTCVYVVSEIAQGDLLDIQRKDPKLSTVFLPAEYMTQFVQPLCGKMLQKEGGKGARVARSTNIVDLSGVGVGLFWNLRKLLQTSSSMATAHYPESVERIFVVGAPSFFPTIWGFVQRWFEPATTAKIHVLAANQVTETLEQFIDLEDLPRRFGGKLEWEFGDQPVLDEETKGRVGKLREGWIGGPIRLLDRPEGDEIVALGKDHKGVMRREVLAKERPGRPRTDSKLDP